MAIIVGVLKETFSGERRVALTPRALDVLKKAGVQSVIETGAGNEAGYSDEEFMEKGAQIASAADVRQLATVLAFVRVPEPAGVRSGQIVVGFCDPLSDPELAARYAKAGAMLFSMEMIPRTTRAQSMDALSSLASIAGYKAVLVAANELPRLFPMMTTAAGTIPPARVLVIGAGVAGLQAIATARRLGAVVSAYDVRAAVKEQIESLGAKFVNISMDVKAEGEGGYAKALDEEAYKKQREQMAAFLKDQDVVITTAAIPGKKSPILITREMVHMMSAGSVIIDLAAERGGNCEVTRAGETVIEHGVTVLGPLNLTSTVPYHASQMYGRNVATFLANIVTKGELNIDMADEITRDSLITRDGEVVNPRIQALLGTGSPK